MQLRTLGDVDLVVLPELWNVGYFMFDEYHARAEEVAGPTLSSVAAAAADLDVAIVAGSILEVDRASGHLYNTAAVITRDGQIEATYRKMHVFGYQSREPELVRCGTSPTTVTLAGMSIGLAICYDLRFPELFRLERVPPEVIVIPATWPLARVDHWRALLRARAIENQSYVVACNAAGENAGVALGGHSAVIAPDGDIVVEGGVEPGVLRATIDLTLPSRSRREFPALDDRMLSLGLTRPSEVS